MNELTSSPVRCPCAELEELRKFKADMSSKEKELEASARLWKQEYDEAYKQYVLFREANQQLRADNDQLKRTILTLCGVVKVFVGDEDA